MNVDVNISGECDVVLIIDENKFAGKMAALTLKDLKEQVAKLEKSDLRQGTSQFRDVEAKGSAAFRDLPFDSRAGFCDVDIRPVKGILFPEAVFSTEFLPETVGRFSAYDDLVKKIH